MKNSKIIPLLLILLVGLTLSCKRKRECQVSVGCTERSFVLTDSLGNDILTDRELSKVHVYFIQGPGESPVFSTQVEGNRHVIKIDLFCSSECRKDNLGTIPCGGDVVGGLASYVIGVEGVRGRIDTLEVFFGYYGTGEKNKVAINPTSIIINGHPLENVDYNHPCAHKDDIIEIRR